MCLEMTLWWSAGPVDHWRRILLTSISNLYILFIIILEKHYGLILLLSSSLFLWWGLSHLWDNTLVYKTEKKKKLKKKEKIACTWLIPLPYNKYHYQMEKQVLLNHSLSLSSLVAFLIAPISPTTYLFQMDPSVCIFSVKFIFN